MPEARSGAGSIPASGRRHLHARNQPLIVQATMSAAGVPLRRPQDQGQDGTTVCGRSRCFEWGGPLARAYMRTPLLLVADTVVVGAAPRRTGGSER
ncbi:hypothetical protein GCM10010341_39710 [Streptomyces noursei]|nr:hypothetical protein GCM10010341_39710 [Streptomyces noursei]